MRLILAAAAAACLATTSYAQDMGGMGGMGQGGGGHGGGRHSGGQRGQGAPAGDGQAMPARPAAAVLSATQRIKGVITVSAVSRALSKGTIPSETGDVSAIYVTRGGQATLDTVDILTTGAASLVADSHEVGINSALLIDTGSAAKVTGGHIATRGEGANAAYVSGDGSHLSLKGTALATSGTGSYGVEVRAGAEFEADGINVATESDHASALFAGRGSRPLRIAGGTFTTDGPLSPGFDLSASLEAQGVKLTAGRDDAVVVNGSHRVAFSDSHLTGDGYGIRLYDAPDPDHPAGGFGPGNNPPGGGFGPRPDGGDRTSTKAGAIPDAQFGQVPGGPHTAELTLAGGSLDARRAAFYVSNLTAHIVLDNVALTSRNGMVLRAAADQWGTLGRNGGVAHLEATHQTLTGDLVTDAISSIDVNLRDNSHLTGLATLNVAITIDATSTWTLTDDTRVGKLSADPARIDSQGHTLTYDRDSNPQLNGATMGLPGGGKLMPTL